MSASQHPLVRFYRGEAADGAGRFLREIRGWDAAQLERVHDYIQWLFPLRTYSQFNPDAPVLADEVVALFRADDRLRGELVASCEQMLAFYGFICDEGSGHPVISPSPDAPARQRNWLTPGNHNLLRITRILTCLSTLGLRPRAEAFLAALEKIYRQRAAVIGGRTISFWRQAIDAGDPLD